MLVTIAIIVLFGIVLMMVETFVPGGVLGTLGIACILSGIALSLFADDFAGWTLWQRCLLAFAIVAIASTILLIWLRCFSGRFFHSTFTLDATIRTPAPPDVITPGAEGIAISELRPLGRAEFDGQRHEVRCEGGFAPAGARVQVIGTEPGNLLVRLIEQPKSLSTSTTTP